MNKWSGPLRPALHPRRTAQFGAALQSSGERHQPVRRDPGAREWSDSQASQDFKFAAAVAGFGTVLRDSPYKGNANLDAGIELAEEGKGRDQNGYRAEFIGLVKEAKRLGR